MPPDGPTQRRGRQLRRDVRLTFANALVWAVGNGLVSTFLVGYLALELGAGQIAVAFIVAAPRFAGLLRLAAPWVLAAANRYGLGRKGLSVALYVASGAVLAAIPTATWNADAPGASIGLRIAVLAFAWCFYHLLEYLATIFLWSWIGDLYPARRRGRLLGVRESYLTLGRFIGLGVSILLAAFWRELTGDPNARTPLAVSAWCGVALMLTAVVPLLFMRPLSATASARPTAPWKALVDAFVQRPYRRLLAYHAWLAFANGLTGAAQAAYPRQIGIPYEKIQTCSATMWLGQSAIAPWSGRLVERFGAKRVMLPTQVLVATGPLWFWMASAEQAWWIALAYVVWIAYTPINIALDTLKIKLAAPGNNTPYLAAFHAVSDATNGVTILMGGLLYETLSRGGEDSKWVYSALFLSGWIARTLAAVLVMRLIEPEARSD